MGSQRRAGVPPVEATGVREASPKEIPEGGGGEMGRWGEGEMKELNILSPVSCLLSWSLLFPFSCLMPKSFVE